MWRNNPIDDSYIIISELQEELEKYKKYYDWEKQELADSCYDFKKRIDELETENGKLKERIERYEKEEDRLNKLIDMLKSKIEVMEKQLEE